MQYFDFTIFPGAGGDPNLATVCPDTPNLPKLTDPLSPPAFNPHEIQLDSNEAIAGIRMKKTREITHKIGK